MLKLKIPGFGPIKIEHLVSDFTGTLSVNGILLPGIRMQLNEISKFLQVHILTADTFGKAKKELEGINCIIHILKGKRHDIQKEEYINKLGAETVVAFGNGNNDRKMLKSAKIGISVSEGEGCAVEAIMASNIHVPNANAGLDLLLHPKRLKATLRF